MALKTSVPNPLTFSCTVWIILYILLDFSLQYCISHKNKICNESIKFKPENQGIHKSLDSSYLQRFDEILVIGDVHGCYDELISLLTGANVLDDNALKIFTGDLVRKGQKNIEILDMVIASNSMLSVRGNHDDAVLQEYIKSKNPQYKFQNSDDEWIRLLSQQHVQFLSQLPHTITLLPLNIIVVHAGLIPGIQVQDNDPYYLMNLRNIVLDEQQQCLHLLTQSNVGQSWSMFWQSSQHVVFGHDSRKMLQIRENATGIDTGCVYGNFLTGYFISGPRTGYIYTVKALKQYSVHQN